MQEEKFYLSQRRVEWDRKAENAPRLRWRQLLPLPAEAMHGFKRTTNFVYMQLLFFTHTWVHKLAPHSLVRMIWADEVAATTDQICFERMLRSLLALRCYCISGCAFDMVAFCKHRLFPGSEVRSGFRLRPPKKKQWKTRRDYVKYWWKL